MSTPSRYARQEIFAPIGAEGQRRIAASSAAVVGCGALGSNIANGLARSGVGRLRIVDRDFVELSNLQRQALFDEDHVRRRLPKAIAAVERLARINSAVQLEAEVGEVSPANIESLLDGCDIVLDGTDNIDARLLLNDACLKARVPYIFGGAVGATGMTMAIIADQTPCFRCLLGTLPEPGTAPTAATAGILNATTAVVAALQCTQALRILTGTFEPRGEVLCIDVWDGELCAMTVPRAPDCPACVERRFEFLTSRPAARPAPVPGTNSVRLPSRGPVSLDRLVAAWRAAGAVAANPWLASLAVGEHEIIVFADGRGLVRGTEDVGLAVDLFERHVGTASEGRGPDGP